MNHLLLGIVMAFLVIAPSKDISNRLTTQANEHYRQISKAWTGKEISRSHACLIHVSINKKRFDGWTFYRSRELFGVGAIKLEGTEDEVTQHSLPHEIAHVVLADHFGYPPPRWLDEGIAVSCEIDAPARVTGRCADYDFQTLFSIQDYPEDWRAYYYQCYSVVKYLSNQYSRQSVLRFGRQGIDIGWEKASIDMFGKTLKELYDDWKRKCLPVESDGEGNECREILDATHRGGY